MDKPAPATRNRSTVALLVANLCVLTLYSGGATFRRNPDQSSPRKWVRVEEQGAN